MHVNQPIRAIYFLLSLIILSIACSKEYSFEGNNIFFAQGGLQDSSGNCAPITVSGMYTPATSFSSNNYILVHANITSPGTFKIFTDTINGYYFIDSGRVNNNGSQSFKLMAHGKPIVSATANFTVRFNESYCTFTILPDSAIYTFASTGSGCPNANVYGSYKPGTAPDASDTVKIIVNVTKPGSYSIQTQTVNGISFISNGIFYNTGNYTVKLTGTGIPIYAGTTILPITIAGAACSFAVEVSSGDKVDSTMTWQLSAGGMDYKGYLDSAIRSISTVSTFPNNIIYALEAYGKPDSRSLITFELQLSRINQPISTGTYHPAITGSKDFVGYVAHSDSSGNYSANINLPAFSVVVSTYDTISGFIKGTFSGPVLNQYGQTLTMTNGAFQTYYKR